MPTPKREWASGSRFDSAYYVWWDLASYSERSRMLNKISSACKDSANWAKKQIFLSFSECSLSFEGLPQRNEKKLKPPNFLCLRQYFILISPFVADSRYRRNNSAKNMAYFLEWARNHRTFASVLRFTHKVVRLNFLFHIAGLLVKQLALAVMRALAA